MKRLLAFLRARPKTAIAAVVVLMFVAAGIWEAAGRPKPVVQYGLAMPTLAIRENAVSGSAGMGYAAGMPAPAPAYDIGIMPPTPYPPTTGATAADVDQKIVKNGYLDLVVDAVPDAADEVGQIAKTDGGFVQSSNVTENGDGTHSGQVSVRVPVDKFDAAMSDIKKLATLVKSETSTGQDVTEQYTDLQAQLRNAQAQEETYLAILKQAKTVNDTLQVQQQLGIIRGTIESLQGRIQYLTNTTSYSTISVTLEEEPVVRAPTKEFRLGAIVKEATQALVAAVQNIVAGVIWAVILWGGILLPLGLLIWIVVKIWKRRRKPAPKKR